MFVIIKIFFTQKLDGSFIENDDDDDLKLENRMINRDNNTSGQKEVEEEVETFNLSDISILTDYTKVRTSVFVM